MVPEFLDPYRDHWHFGWEMGRIARSIVEGHGFSSPFFDPSGPTAMLPPAYPYLVAAVHEVVWRLHGRDYDGGADAQQPIRFADGDSGLLSGEAGAR